MGGPKNLQRSLPTSSYKSVYPPVEVAAERVIHKLEQLFVSQGSCDA